MSKSFVVVGGSRGIGRRIVEKLADDSNVLVFSRQSNEVDELENVTHISLDVRNDEMDSATLPEHIDGFVYCPGTVNLRSFRALKPADFVTDFDLNVVGAVRSLKSCLPKMKSDDPKNVASVVLFSTVAVQTGMRNHASVAASKGAIEGLTRSLAAELSPSIRVNCIAPALTETDLTERFFSSDEKKDQMASKYPLGRTGTKNDSANLAEFLLSDDSSWMTGQVIGLDGGMSSLLQT